MIGILEQYVAGILSALFRNFFNATVADFKIEVVLNLLNSKNLSQVKYSCLTKKRVLLRKIITPVCRQAGIKNC